MKISFVSYCLFLFLGFNYTIAQEMDSAAAVLYNEGNKLLKAGNFMEAIAQYNMALNVVKDYRIFYQKGTAYIRAKELDSARIALEESIKLNPDFEAAYSALGGVFLSTKNYDSSAAIYEKVILISKDSSIISSAKKNLAMAYFMLGNEAISKKNNKKALEYLQKAVENDTLDRAYLSLAKVHSGLGQFDKTLEAAENALKYKSKISEAGPYYYMGLAYKGKKDLKKAKEMFTNALSDSTYGKPAKSELDQLK